MLHIEHHIEGTLRIAEMADGTFRVQEWNCDDYYGGDWRWRTVSDGIFSHIEAARKLYDILVQQKIAWKNAKLVKSVILQQEE